MAIRVNFTKSEKPPVKSDQAFSSDRATALARLAKPVKTTAAPGPEVLPRTSPGPEVPAEVPAARIADQPRIAPVAPRESAPAVEPVKAASAAESSPPAAAEPVSLAAAPGGKPVSGAGAAPGEAAKKDTPVSEALLNPSFMPALLRAAGRTFKWSAFLGAVLGIGFLVVRFLVPFLQELHTPGKTDALADKAAPTAVRAIQQTRAVAAKSEANVAYLHEVVATVGEKPAAAAPAPALPPPVVRTKAPGTVALAPDLTPYHAAVARLKVGGVFEGPVPRIYLNDRIVAFGEIVDRNLGLRFMGVDPKDNAVLFTNAANVIFRKRY